MPYKYKFNQAVSSHKWYGENKQHIIDKKNARRKIAQIYIRKTKTNQKCIKCKNKFPWYILDYHHKANTAKKYIISSMPIRNSSIAAIKIEIDKCDLLCSNCHREYTFNATKT